MSTSPEQQPVRVLAVSDLVRMLTISREQAGMTVGELADLAGVEVAWLEALEAGELEPGLRRALQLVAALGLSLRLHPER